VLLIFDARGDSAGKTAEQYRHSPLSGSPRGGPFIMKRGIVEYHEIPGSTAIPVIILSLVIGITGFGMA
jgi:hypothetical protein